MGAFDYMFELDMIEIGTAHRLKGIEKMKMYNHNSSCTEDKIVKTLPRKWIVIPEVEDFIAPTTSFQYGTFDVYDCDNKKYSIHNDLKSALNYCKTNKLSPQIIAEFIKLPNQPRGTISLLQSCVSPDNRKG